MLSDAPLESSRAGELRAVVVGTDARKIELVIPDDEGARFVFREIFERHCYKHAPRVPSPKAVLDIGSNIGLAAAYFRLLYPAASIDCVEPDAGALNLLRQNAARIGNCRIHAIGLYEGDCEKTFYSASQSVNSSLTKNPYAHASPLRLRLHDAGAFVRGIGVERFDVIKIDTEGAEVPIIRSLGEALRRAAIVHIEFHSREDRRAIDYLMNLTHCLCQGIVESAHRGQFTYVANDMVSYEAWEHPLSVES